MTQNDKPPVRNWRWILTLGMSIGIGIPIGGNVAAAIYPDPDSFWQPLLVGAAVAGLASAVIALTVKHGGKLIGSPVKTSPETPRPE